MKAFRISYSTFPQRGIFPYSWSLYKSIYVPHRLNARPHTTHRQARHSSSQMFKRGMHNTLHLQELHDAFERRHNYSAPPILKIDGSQSSMYGKCIFADYNNVRKDMCVNEFMKLKECYLVRSNMSRPKSKLLTNMSRRHTNNGSMVTAQSRGP